MSVAPDDARSIRELVRTFAIEKVALRAAAVDEQGEFPWDIVESMREHHLFALPFATTHGGTGTGALVFCKRSPS